ncbi:MAG: hypothetical protein QM537_01705 [Candidatus Symbiobacter sp.]|nr:hypothetical protein [Candidatus Symbiobacter sp.]
MVEYLRSGRPAMPEKVRNSASAGYQVNWMKKNWPDVMGQTPNDADNSDASDMSYFHGSTNEAAFNQYAASGQMFNDGNQPTDPMDMSVVDAINKEAVIKASSNAS